MAHRPQTAGAVWVGLEHPDKRRSRVISYKCADKTLDSTRSKIHTGIGFGVLHVLSIGGLEGGVPMDGPWTRVRRVWKLGARSHGRPRRIPISRAWLAGRGSW